MWWFPLKLIATTGWSKKSALFCFSSQSCVSQVFSYFSGGVESRPGRFFWHQYGSNCTICYAAVDKNHWGVLCLKTSSSDTAAMQERFWQEQCTWYKDNSKFGGQILGASKCSRCPTKATVVDIVQIVQIQQTRIIFNPLTDIFIKCFSFCFILISLPLQDLNFVRKKLKVIMEDPQNCFSQNASFLWETACWFSGGFLNDVPINSEYSQELCRMINDVVLCGHLPQFLSSEIWPQSVELSFHQVHCYCQNLSCIAAVSEELTLRQSMPQWFLSAVV